MEYNFREIEKKWQKIWVDNHTYQVNEDASKQNSMYSICSPILRVPDCT